MLNKRKPVEGLLFILLRLV